MPHAARAATSQPSMIALWRPRQKRWRRSAAFEPALPEQSSAAETVLAELDELGSPPRWRRPAGAFFGFVTGGALPVTVAANWLATAWDQNAAMVVTAPTQRAA